MKRFCILLWWVCAVSLAAEKEFVLDDNPGVAKKNGEIWITNTKAMATEMGQVGDFTLSGEMQIVQMSESGRAVIVCRFEGGRFLSLKISASQVTLEHDEVPPAAPKPSIICLGRTAHTPALDRWVRFEITIKGQQITASWSNIKFRAFDPALPLSGLFDVRAVDAQIALRNVRLRTK